MIPIIGFVGDKKSGKTAVLEAVIAELKKKGRKVGVIKHTTHGFQLDYPHTDSAKLAKAGAKKIVLLGDRRIGLYGAEQGEPEPERVRDLYLSELDVVLVEGFKNAAIPKVLVALNAPAPKWAKEIGGLIAAVSKNKTGLKVRHFQPGRTKELALLVEGYIKSHRKKREVKIYLDGRSLQIKPFIKDFCLNTIVGIIGSLRDSRGAKRIQITIDLPKGVSVSIPGD